MYRVLKVLSNNSVLAIVGNDSNDEIILLGKGVGFGCKIGDYIKDNENIKKYKLSEADIEKNVINSTEPVYFEITNEIIQYAKELFVYFDESVLIPLADHISFAIERMRKDMNLENPFTNDIRLLFEEEYQVALKGKEIIKNKIGMTISEDEIAYITLHIHSGVVNNSGKVADSIKIASIIREYVLQMENDFNIEINDNSVFYVRLMAHLKYLLLRIDKEEELEIDLSEYIKSSYPYSYSIAYDICVELSKVLNVKLSEAEVGYLAIHIERIKSDQINKQSIINS